MLGLKKTERWVDHEAPPPPRCQVPPPRYAPQGGSQSFAGPEDVAQRVVHRTHIRLPAAAPWIGIIRLNIMLNLISMISKLSKADFSSLIYIYT